jgi:glycosyltransferase involved in cell wall biosynthesis
MLKAVGVEVTGWKTTREEVFGALATGHVFLHTAAWEGRGLSILEAEAIGLPVVARRVPALMGAPVSQWFSTPTEAAQMIGQLRDGARWRELADSTRTVFRATLESNDIDRAIADAYGLDTSVVVVPRAVPAI